MAMQHIENELRRTGDHDLAKIVAGVHEAFEKRHLQFGDITLPSALAPAPTSVEAVETKIVEPLPSSEHLVIAEKQALSAFFGKDIAVSEPPQELFQTLEQMSKLGITGFEPHFLPQVSLTEKDKFPGWKVRPESWFWKQIKDGKISADSATLQAGWYLVDGRQKPNYDNGQQRYENDYLEPIMADLRKTGKIQKYSSVPDISRFGASPDKIEGIILPEVVRITGAKGETSPKRYIELNIWGNMFHPKWGQTNTSEWFADNFGDSYRLVGGHSDYGGLAHVYGPWSDDRHDHIAFSPVVRFPSKPR